MKNNFLKSPSEVAYELHRERPQSQIFKGVVAPDQIGMKYGMYGWILDILDEDMDRGCYTDFQMSSLFFKI